jgi:hypothetical protein
MAENSINNIIFKIEGSAANSEFETVNPGIQSSETFKGTISVAAINLSDDKEDGSRTAVDAKTPVFGGPLLRYIINDATENLYSVNFVTDESGSASIDLTTMLRNTQFIKFYQKYKGKVSFNVTIEIPKTDTYNVFVGNAKITPELKREEGSITFENYDYSREDVITVSSIEEKITDLATLRQRYKTVEDNYLLIKKQFESQTVGEIDLEIDTAETYEPKTFKNVITRLLEFQVGTLTPAIEYTKTAKLTTENERLNTINKLINIICKMYPKITIEDGEGIPYDNSDLEIAEA